MATVDAKCVFCHEATTNPQVRSGHAICGECADSWDYHASLTPEERRAEEASMARYVDEQQSQ